jgi:hypothetical protein
MVIVESSEKSTGSLVEYIGELDGCRIGNQHSYADDLTLGHHYVVDKLVVKPMRTIVWLKNMPGYYNSVMFKNVPSTVQKYDRLTNTSH